MHAGLGPEQVPPAHVHLLELLHVLGGEAEVPDVEVVLDTGGGHRLERGKVRKVFVAVPSGVSSPKVCPPCSTWFRPAAGAT